MQTILVTGATGFVGSALCKEFDKRGMAFLPAVRTAIERECFVTGEIDGGTNWSDALRDCSVVVHLAARVHQIDTSLTGALEAYRVVNVNATLNLARQASTAGVKRFIFLSSSKVNGEGGYSSSSYSSEDVPAPKDPYGISKWEAEQLLLEVGKRSGMDVVIIRPPLVYGPGVKANFLRLMKLIKRGVPLPFALIRNKRSLIGLDNLVDFIALCIFHPKAAGRTWMVSDQRDVSTPELVRIVASAMNKRAHLFPIPPVILTKLAHLLHQSAAVARLVESLQVDSGPASGLLGWKPPVSVEEGIRRTVVDFIENQKS